MGRGRPIDRSRWPDAGPHRTFLELLDKVHRDNGLKSRRDIAADMNLRAHSRVSGMLDGVALPADVAQARALVHALGGSAEDMKRGERYYHAIETGLPAQRPNDAEAQGLPPGKPVSQWNPLDLGVHRAIELGAGPELVRLPTLPPYVHRRHDSTLRGLLRNSRCSMMAVLVGGSSTGKTRACYEAVSRLPGLSDWRIAYPADGRELGQLLSGGLGDRLLLWLNETQLYLDGEHGPAVAARLRQVLTDDSQRVLIVGSMWPSYWRDFTTRPGLGMPDRYGQVRELLGLGKVCKIDVPADFSVADGTERAELAALAAEDPRLAAAVQTAGPQMTVVQVLAGGEMMVDRYEHILGPQSRALITAAMDARVVGYRDPLPASFLAQAITGYLTAPQRVAGDTWFSDSMEEVTEIVRGIRVLEPNRAPRGMGLEDSYVLHDYMEQYGRNARRGRCLPGECWDALAAHAHSGDDCDMISATAQFCRLCQYAVVLATPGAEAGSVNCMHRLGELFLDAGHDAEGEQWLRRAIDAGSNWSVGRLVSWLRESGREDDVESLVRSAAERGHAESIADVARREQDAGRGSEADFWLDRLHQAAEAGSRGALEWWVSWLKYSRHPEYEHWLLRAAAAGISAAIVTMAKDEMWRSPNPAVEPILQQASDHGDVAAMNMLERLLEHQGRGRETQEMWTRAARKGSAYAMKCLAALLLRAGDSETSGQWLHRAAVAGNADAMCLWAGRLARDHHDDDAEVWLRLASGADEVTAIDLGAAWVTGTRSREDARETLTAMTGIRDNEGIRFIPTRSGPAAEQWLREVTEGGSVRAMNELTYLMEKSGRHAELERWLRHIIEAGIPDPRVSEFNLTTLLYKLERHREARKLTRFGIKPGGSTADPW